MELSSTGVATMAFGRIVGDLSNVLADTILEETALLDVKGGRTLQPILDVAQELVLGVVVAPVMGMWSDQVGRKPLIVGASAVAATVWACLSMQRRQSKTMINWQAKVGCKVVLALCSQAWQIGFGALVSDLELEPSTEQWVHVATTFAQSLVSGPPGVCDGGFCGVEGLGQSSLSPNLQHAPHTVDNTSHPILLTTIACFHSHHQGCQCALPPINHVDPPPPPPIHTPDNTHQPTHQTALALNCNGCNLLSTWLKYAATLSAGAAGALVRLRVFRQEFTLEDAIGSNVCPS
jgi:hypothetical protein